MALAGMVKLVVKLPVASVLVVPTLVSSKLMVTLELAAKPLPLTVPVSPTRPEVGVMLTFCPVVKVAVAKLPLASWALIV